MRQQDMVLLVEGSAYMDTWTSALLWAFLWTTHCAHVSERSRVTRRADPRRLVGRLKAAHDELGNRIQKGDER